MSIRRIFLPALVSLAAMTLAALPLGAQSYPSQSTPGQSSPSRPGQQAPATPDQQPPSNQTAATPPTQSQIMQALMNDPELSQYALTASVQPNGTVTLNGSVPNAKDKQQAANLVKSLGGVAKLQNSIVVNAKTTPLQGATAGATPQGQANHQTTPDQIAPTPAQAGAQPAGSDVQSKMQTALTADPALSGVTVAVNGKVLTLSGTVASKADKAKAASIAKQNAAGMKIHNLIMVSKS